MDDLELCLYAQNLAKPPCVFIANLKIDAIYALYPESFCDKNLAIRKVFAFCDSVWILVIASRHFSNYPEILQPIMNLSQKLSGFAKTFRVAMLPCYPGFCASAIIIHICHLSNFLHLQQENTFLLIRCKFPPLTC